MSAKPLLPMYVRDGLIKGQGASWCACGAG